MERVQETKSMIRAQSPTWEEDMGPDETSGPIAGSGALWIRIE